VTLQRAMREADALGARDLKHIDVAAEYAEAGAWAIEALVTLGRGEEARRVGADAGAVAAKVLEVRPGYLVALRAQNLISSNLAGLAIDDMRDQDALVLIKRGEEASRSLAKFDPGNLIAVSNHGVDLRSHADASWFAGRPHESVELYKSATDIYSKAENSGASFILNLMNARATLVSRQADIGDMEGVRVSQAKAAKNLASLRRSEPAGSANLAFGECLFNAGSVDAALVNADPATARRLGRECISHMSSLVPQGSTQEFFRNAGMFYQGDSVGQAEYMLGDYAAAERTLRAALDARKRWPTNNNTDRREQGEVSTWLAMALARQGRSAESKSVIAPVVKLQRELTARNRDDQWQHVELAVALYAQALTDKLRRTALLKEAAALVAQVPAEMRDLRSVRLWHERIRKEQRTPAVAMTRAAADRGAG
jgi:tetratricopeptide (TPR) repeat protein